jgi:hypothetical protein
LWVLRLSFHQHDLRRVGKMHVRQIPELWA